MFLSTIADVMGDVVAAIIAATSETLAGDDTECEDD